MHVLQTLPAARIIDDLQVRVWIRAEQRGIQLLGRIVFPDAVDPLTGEVASVLIPGRSYDRVGQWQQLDLGNIPLEMHRQLRILRARTGQPVAARDAYLDAVVVNAYGGPGTTRVWLGPVDHEGAVAPPEAGRATPVSYTETALDPQAVPRRRVSRLIVDGRPFFPRLVEHRGEPFPLLRQLGFNSVYLDHWPTEAEHRAAEDVDLWILCPPPAEENQEIVNASRILGWFLGDDHVAARHPEDFLDQVRRRDPHARPLVAGVSQEQWLASRELDIVLRSRLPIGSSFELSHFGPWLHQVTRLVRPGTPFWASVQTELPASLVEQVRVTSGQTGPIPTNIQSEQIRQMALAAVAAGARGLWYHSETPLDGTDPSSELRRLMLELVNLELALIEPWTMGGHRLGVVEGQNAELRVISLATERSRLLIPTYVQPSAQFACRPPAGENRLIIPGVPDSTDAFLLNHMGLTPITRHRISGGLQLHLEPESADSLVLLTEDALVVTHINRTVTAGRKRVVQLQQEIADHLLWEFENQAPQQLLKKFVRVEAWEAARSALRQSRELSEANDLSSAFRFGQLARRELNRLQADVWREAVAEWPSPLWQPMGTSFGLVTRINSSSALPIHTEWSQNRLAGGDCENLTSMIERGWRQYRSSPQDVLTYLALSPSDPHSGQHCLRIAVRAQSKDAEQSVVEFPPVWIHSAPVTVRPGDRVRIAGWVRIDEPIQGSLDGLLIGDSISGPELALRFRQTVGWQPFEMIRSVPQHDHLTLSVTLHGLGEVWLDDLSVVVAEATSDQDPLRMRVGKRD